MTTLLRSVAFAASKPSKPEAGTDDIALVSINGELLQRPYAPFHLREVTNEMAALLVLDWFEECMDLDGSRAVDNM